MMEAALVINWIEDGQNYSHFYPQVSEVQADSLLEYDCCIANNGTLEEFISKIENALIDAPEN